MNIEYHKVFSPRLNRDMEYKTYGFAGRPVICIPCQCGRFYEFEDMHMLDVFAPYINSGDIQVFAIDSIDAQTLAADGDPAARISLHEEWINYIVEEAIPQFKKINAAANNIAVEDVKFFLFGISLGALHSSVLIFRFPDLFYGCMGLSGIYTTEYHFGDFHNGLTYLNSPTQFLKDIPQDHPYLQKYRRLKLIFCVGQGAWEVETLQSTQLLKERLSRAGIPALVDIWGYDVRHDWEWWYVQASYFLPKLLDL